MKALTRDISITLLVKFILLVLLWWVCFSHVEKPVRDARQWLLGSSVSDETQSMK
ncbi:cytochrome oxidase putative small subunit CydP [Legionella sp. MW5194]|uniref:cytochrome oxidase putative small subunit CydP n=1 Tax=Legionella sp. MW5194 TaxID=2662448 RepID=UPI00193D48E6|nr:cytochrome oxidase putative small subunit CydP [Legionella sp. MW5194]